MSAIWTRRPNSKPFAPIANKCVAVKPGRPCYGLAVDTAGFQRVVEEGRALQARLADFDPVVVGGTAAALHCRHRFSMDVDVVTLQLSGRFAEAVAILEDWEDWRTNRLNPPVLILGERGSVELGVRQLRPSVPLQTTCVSGLQVPSAAETLRVKAFLLTERHATRDFVDVAALTQHLGIQIAVESVGLLNLVYGPREPQTRVSAFAEACESDPLDLTSVSLPAYKGLGDPLTDWSFVAASCRELGRAVLKRELANALATVLPTPWTQEPPP